MEKKMISKKHVWITGDEIRKSENTIYVFGDNLEQWGEGGQALVARRFVKKRKAMGIPTKRSPKTSVSACFSDQDDEIKAVKQAFREIVKQIKKGKKIIFFPGIGEGRADLKNRSPIIHAMIRDFINGHQKIDIERLRGNVK